MLIEWNIRESASSALLIVSCSLNNRSRRERALVTNKLKPKEDENFQIGEVVISTRLVMRVRSYHWLLCHSLAQSLLSYFRNQRHGNGGRGWGGMR
ncbi:hypothetical protein L1987_10293 [Smallanthus sonchifolius]|uniref:Uncharacterized protein n=1 Tax=Smallanthus sonchifolius TaxID=185202 RepID=A0ACB9JRP9_9ASTR|nr:hypothetical protein L1987_10293 [Smallanthus sonchifolius]